MLPKTQALEAKIKVLRKTGKHICGNGAINKPTEWEKILLSHKYVCVESKYLYTYLKHIMNSHNNSIANIYTLTFILHIFLSGLFFLKNTHKWPTGMWKYTHCWKNLSWYNHYSKQYSDSLKTEIKNHCMTQVNLGLACYNPLAGTTEMNH